MSEFVGRETELAELASEFEADRYSLAILYGRRRIGKSALLMQAARRHGPFVYYQATKVEEPVNIAAFKRAITDALGDDAVLAGLTEWEPVLSWLAKKAIEVPKLLVILDEFSYLTGGKDVLPSILQRFVDCGAMDAGRLKLVLCGSIVSHMEDLLSERNALFGRRTMKRELKELPLRDSALLMPGYDDKSVLEAYATFGGVPYYLNALDSSRSLGENMVDLLLTPAGRLYNEPELLMQTELRETSRYASIVAAIAGGATKTGEIISRAGLRDGSQVSAYLETLGKLRIVRGLKSYNAFPKDRDVRYFVSDPLFRFWFRFVQPYVSAVEAGKGQAVFDHRVRPGWSTYMGGQFEDICREHMVLHGDERLPAPLGQVGKAWAADHDMDIMGETLDGSLVAGECKWESKPLGSSVLRGLRQNAALYNRDGKPQFFTLFSKAGYTQGVSAEAAEHPDLLLYELSDLVRTPEPSPDHTIGM